MCHDRDKYPYDIQINKPGDTLDGAIPIRGDGAEGYLIDALKPPRFATSIGRCLKCNSSYAAIDSRFGPYPPDGYRSLFLS